MHVINCNYVRIFVASEFQRMPIGCFYILCIVVCIHVLVEAIELVVLTDHNSGD